MKIGLTICTFYPRSGGLQAHAEKLIRELESQGHEVAIVTRAVSRTPSYKDYFFFSEPVAETNVNGLNVHIIRHSPSLNWLMWIIYKCVARPIFCKFGVWLFQLLFTRQVVTAFQGVDVIHHVGQAHEMIGFAALAAAQKLGVPFLIQPTLHPGQWGDSPFDFCLYNQAQRLLVHTEFERNFLKEHSIQSPCDVVGNGIEDRTDGNAERFRQSHNITGPIILFLGRKTPDKGYLLVKQAFAAIYAQRPNVTLVCMGPSPASTDSAKSATESIENGVLELDFGQEQDKHDALAACALLCMPSAGESFGLVYMEAGRYAKPSVGCCLPVLEELLNREKAIVLVGKACGKGNQVSLNLEELENALFSLLDHPELAEQIGKSAYSVSEQFIWPKVVCKFEAAYRSAVEGLSNIATVESHSQLDLTESVVND